MVVFQMPTSCLNRIELTLNLILVWDGAKGCSKNYNTLPSLLVGQLFQIKYESIPLPEEI